MVAIPYNRQAFEFLQEGASALARVEDAGIRMDEEHLRRTIEEVSQELEKLEGKLQTHKIWREWRKVYGKKRNIDSPEQLATILFDRFGYTSIKNTPKTGRPSSDEDNLIQTGSKFVPVYLRYRRLNKLRSTYLRGILRECCNGYLHPSFSLHLVKTFRGQSDSPNFQNIPIRIPEIAALIRPAFIPREGHVLLEIDYAALEFRIAACFWRDSAMIDYASNPDKDIHRDMAAECYDCPREQVSKQMRFFAKNQFVFPTLYGSYFVNTSANLLKVAPELQLADETPLLEHLAACGIGGGGESEGERLDSARAAMEDHVQGVERRFMHRFPKFAADRDRWWELYQKRGWFELMSGFVVQGVYSKNFVYNCPIQGPAFHILLWSLIHLVKELRQRRAKSLVVGQIHDSILIDAHRSELEKVIRLAKRIMTEDVREHWSWIATPLEIEAEVGERNWYEKKAVAA